MVDSVHSVLSLQSGVVHPTFFNRIIVSLLGPRKQSIVFISRAEIRLRESVLLAHAGDSDTTGLLNEVQAPFGNGSKILPS